MSNIPYYRAKSINDDSWVVGFLIIHNGYLWIIDDQYKFELKHKIDPATLAIHFPGVVDKNGKDIFASLGDGRGSDILDAYSCTGEHDITLAKFRDGQLYLTGRHCFDCDFGKLEFKGIYNE